MLEILESSVLYEFTPIVAITISTFASLLMGFIVSYTYRFKSDYSHSLSKTLVLLPALVQIIIFFASENIGVGIAVAGAFSLIRFRSIAGNARDIAHLFLAMSLGFVTGLGYLFFALIFLLCIGFTSLVLTYFNYGNSEDDTHNLRIKIPEDLNYEGVFDDIFTKYTDRVEVESVKTTQMGSLYELKFLIKLKDTSKTQSFLNELRTRNGNLGIVLNRSKLDKYEL